MDIGRFQCGIAAIIYHPQTKTYLLLQRAENRDVGGREWESVTGRVNQGESFESALHREVREELGVAAHLEFIVGTSHFYRGEHTPDNELLGVKYVCTVKDRDAVQIGEEHSAFCWLTAKQIYSMLPSTHWLHQTVQQAELIRNAVSPELIKVFQRASFETD
jgi:8-oxo-dGTP diphosphatase